MMFNTYFAIASLANVVFGHGDHADQIPMAGPHKSLWYNTLPGDGGTQVCELMHWGSIERTQI